MKRAVTYIISMAVLAVMLTGCGFLDTYAHFAAGSSQDNRKTEAEEPELIVNLQDAREFEVEDYGITLTASKDWEKSEETPFDLQIGDGNSYLSIMAYDKIDLADDQTPEDIYKWHNEDLFGRRDNVELVEEPITYTGNGKTITRAMYSAERDGMKNYYCSCLVTFEGGDVFAWVIMTGTPSYLVKHLDSMLEIVDTMALSHDI